MIATFDQVIYEKLAPVLGCAVYPGEAAPDATLPYVVQDEASQESFWTIAGLAYLDAWVLVIEIYAATRAQARALAKETRTTLEALTSTTVGAFRVKRVALDDEDANVLGPDHGEDQGTHVVTLTFRAQFGGV